MQVYFIDRNDGHFYVRVYFFSFWFTRKRRWKPLLILCSVRFANVAIDGGNNNTNTYNNDRLYIWSTCNFMRETKEQKEKKMIEYNLKKKKLRYSL